MLSSSFLVLIALSLCLGGACAASGHDEDERSLRSMVDQAIIRLNRGDVTAFEDFWDEHADYGGVDGKLTKGRTAIQALFREMAKAGIGQQTVTIDQIRFITPQLAAIDGSWTVAGARDKNGNQLCPIKGRGFELAQKIAGRWRFIVTRQMVVFGAN